MPEGKITLEDILKLLSKYEIKELEGVKIEGGDIEIEFEMGAYPNFQAIGMELGLAAYHLARVAMMLGFPVQQLFAQQQPAYPAQIPQVPTQLKEEEKIELIEKKFEPYRQEWSGYVEEVQLGATPKEGGTRKYTIKLGGEKSLPFYLFDAEQPHLPSVSVDVFDRAVPLPKAIRTHYEDVMGHPDEWAKKVIKDFGADAVTIHLISTDPLLDDTPPHEAVKTVEEVLQAVKCPIIVGGSGNKEKDPVLLEKVAEVAEGERVLLASATLDTDWERVGRAAKEHGHCVLAWTQMDINSQRTLNRYLLKRIGLPRDSLVMDTTTAALGYGLDYAYTNMERARLAALKGDEDLAFPISSGTTNAWGAREAWMKESPLEGDYSWGMREHRGPLWEILTGLTLSLAGVDIFMMMHPVSVAVLKELIHTLGGKKKEVEYEDWITSEL
jgi:acetyl-CoA decarbonylase/synthase complex subunit delta